MMGGVSAGGAGSAACGGDEDEQCMERHPRRAKPRITRSLPAYLLPAITGHATAGRTGYSGRLASPWARVSKGPRRRPRLVRLI